MSTAPDITTARAGRAVVVTLAGDIDRLNAAGIEAAIEDAAEPGAVGLVCDLSGVDYLDSSGVHLLHAVARALSRRGQRLALVRPRRRTPGDVLRLTGIGDVAPLYDDRDAALIAFGGGGPAA